MVPRTIWKSGKNGVIAAQIIELPIMKISSTIINIGKPNRAQVGAMPANQVTINTSIKVTMNLTRFTMTTESGNMLL